MQTNPQNITFLDMAGKSAPYLLIASVRDLKEKLIELLAQEPRFVEFKSAAGNRLQMGLGGRYACAQFLNQDNTPPYLCAKAKIVHTLSEVEFLCGGTETPIPPELCLSPPEAFHIAEWFYLTGERDAGFEWIEV